MKQPTRDERLVVLGRVGGAFGVKGWVKARSYTDPPGALLGYGPLWLRHGAEWRRHTVESGGCSARGVQLKLAGVDDRDQASALRGAEIAVPRSALPALARGRYYLTDLEGLEVLSPQGAMLGTVSHFIDTGSHPVMVIRGEREHLVPVVPDRLLEVDLANGRITVDWQPDW